MCRLLMCGLLLLPCVGCRGRCDLVEAELRTKERELREAREELDRAGLFNEALHNELRAVGPRAGGVVLPEQASQTYTLKEVVLGRLTGGYDADGKPGDEALQVVLEPRDPDGHAIKVPGALHVEAVQITPEGLKVPLSAWDLSPGELRRSWRSGLFATGYQLVLPWKVWPAFSKMRVTARFTLDDGRVFEADKDVTVRLAPPAVPPGGPVLIPGDDEALPPPTPVGPVMPSAEAGGPPAETAGVLKPASWRRSPAPSLEPGPVRLHRPEPLR
jgi:hypothetical protein